MKDKEIMDEKEAKRLRRKAENPDQSEEEEKKSPYGDEDAKKFEILNHFDFPTYMVKNEVKHIVDFNKDQITLFEIFGEYGTVQRPKENPKYDPVQPPPMPKKEKVVKPPPEVVVDEDGNPLDPQPEQAEEEEKEEEEEEFIPPLDRELYYDFSTHNGKDPILLALMIKGEDDEFTL